MRTHAPAPGFDSEDVDIDMSPMIDLVFLLLIFFMTGSTMFATLQDRRVALPTADDARVPKSLRSRFVVNVYENGAYGDEQGAPLDLDQAQHRLRGAVLADPSTRLVIRSDRRVAHGAVRRLLDQAVAAGVDRVTFSAYTADR